MRSFRELDLDLNLSYYMCTLSRDDLTLEWREDELLVSILVYELQNESEIAVR